jgi:hypothetical protein
MDLIVDWIRAMTSMRRTGSFLMLLLAVFLFAYLGNLVVEKYS